MEIPTTVEDLTPSWVTAALRAAGSIDHAEVVDNQVGLVGRPGMTGQLYRMELTYDERPPQAPASLVVKLSSQHPQAREAVHEMGFYEREIGFYRELARHCPVRTPRCYYSAVDQASGWSVLLLEDLTALHQLTSTGGPVTDVEPLMIDLARLHAAWWRDESLADLTWLPLRGLMTIEQATAQFDATWPTFLDRLSVPLTPELLATRELIGAHLGDVWRDIFDEPPLTLIHHDIQGDNLLRQPEDPSQVTLIDWQLTTRARGVLDLVGFVCGHLDTDERRLHERSLLERYHATLMASGVADYPFEQCWDDYRAALVLPASRLSTAVGIHPALTKTPGAFWNVVFPRYVAAFEDLEVADLLQQRYGRHPPERLRP